MSPLFNSGLRHSLCLTFSPKLNANSLIGVLIFFSAFLLVQCREQNMNYQRNVFITTHSKVDNLLEFSNGQEIIASSKSDLSKQNIDNLLSYISDNNEVHLTEMIQGLVEGHENQKDKVNAFLLKNKEIKSLQYESKTAYKLFEQLKGSNSGVKFNELVNSLTKSISLKGESKWLVIFISHQDIINSLILISFDAINKSLTPEVSLNNSEKRTGKLKPLPPRSIASDLHLAEGSMGGILLLALVIGVIVFGGIAAYKYVKKKKQRLDAEQAKIEKLKFIPRITSQSNDTVFNESINGLKSIFPSKKSKKKEKDGTPSVSTPTYKLPQTLKLEEETHQPSVINDNIFTNIENSPNSSNENSPRDGAKETPRGINFDIEFSILENDKNKK